MRQLTTDGIAGLAREIGAYGPIQSVTVYELFVTSGNATGLVDLRMVKGFHEVQRWRFYLLDGAWRFGSSETVERFEQAPQISPAGTGSGGLRAH